MTFSRHSAEPGFRFHESRTALQRQAVTLRIEMGPQFNHVSPVLGTSKGFDSFGVLKIHLISGGSGIPSRETPTEGR